MIVMPWGRHKGVPIDELDSGYLVWVLENAQRLAPHLATAIWAELCERFGTERPPSSPETRRKPCPDVALASRIVAAGLRTLAKKHHPDAGGDTDTMQLLNATADWLKGVAQ